METLLWWLHRDHQAVLQLTKWLAESGVAQPNPGYLAVLKRAQRHIDAHLCIEDEILFPVLEQKLKDGKVMKLRLEHRRIRHALGMLSGALANQDWPQIKYNARQLWHDFKQLESQEQEELYPLIDDQLSELERVHILRDAIAIRRRVGLPVAEAEVH